MSDNNIFALIGSIIIGVTVSLNLDFGLFGGGFLACGIFLVNRSQD